MAAEPRPDRKLACHRGALLAGQEPRRRHRLVLIPGRRSARGRRARHAACKTAAPKGRPWSQAARRVPRLTLP
jgi:hypothetical protein